MDFPGTLSRFFAATATLATAATLTTAAGLAAAAWVALAGGLGRRRPEGRSAGRAGRAAVRFFAAVSVILVCSGGVGLYFHYRNNAEFEREMYPDRRGSELFREAMTGAVPALAPAAMIQLGLIGLLCTWRQPSGKEDA